MTFRDAFASHQQAVYATLNEWFTTELSYAATIDEGLLESVTILRDFVLRGGKAISPFLLHTAFLLAEGKESPELLKVEGAVELHHKYLLTLDDIADRDEERYGGPTLEYEYRKRILPIDQEHRARSLAMLDAGYLNGIGKKLLFTATFDPQLLIRSHAIMEDAMLAETLAGWKIHYYQNVQQLSEVTPERFIKGLEYVTAHYKFEGPFLIGLLLAGNQSKELELALRTYALSVGTAFQVHDDILGLFGDSAKTGKPVGNDVREGKKTLLMQIAYQRANAEEKSFLASVCGKTDINDDDIKRVQEIVKATGSLNYSQELEQSMVKQGMDALASVRDCESKQHLLELAQYVISREK